MMVGFTKSAFQAQEKRKEVEYTKFAVERRGVAREKGVLTASASKNCAIVDGALTAGEGVKAYRPDGVALSMASKLGTIASFYIQPYKPADGELYMALGCISTAGVAYMFNKAAGLWAQFNNFRTRTVTVPYIGENGVYFVAYISETGMLACDGSHTIISDTFGGSRSMACAFKDRIFCVEDEYTVAYSAPLATADFTESIDDGGKIAVPSDGWEIVALTTFCDSVYIFYEYGVLKLEVAGKARDMKIERLGYNGGRILRDTAAVCSVGGEKLFFLAEDGLYLFDGKRAKRICEELAIRPYRGTQTCACAAAEGKYTVQYVDETGETRRIVVDAASETGYDSFAVEALSAADGKIFCKYEGEPHTLTDADLPTGEASTFTAVGVTFGVEGVKRLQTLRLEGEGRITVAVSSEKRKKTRTVDFVNGRASVRLWQRGRAFSIEATLSKGAVLRKLTAEILYE